MPFDLRVILFEWAYGVDVPIDPAIKMIQPGIVSAVIVLHDVSVGAETSDNLKAMHVLLVRRLVASENVKRQIPCWDRMIAETRDTAANLLFYVWRIESKIQHGRFERHRSGGDHVQPACVLIIHEAYIEPLAERHLKLMLQKKTDIVPPVWRRQEIVIQQQHFLVHWVPELANTRVISDWPLETPNITEVATADAASARIAYAVVQTRIKRVVWTYVLDSIPERLVVDSMSTDVNFTLEHFRDAQRVRPVPFEDA